MFSGIECKPRYAKYLREDNPEGKVGRLELEAIVKDSY
jgi:hypothetical protein